jgi:transposase
VRHSGRKSAGSRVGRLRRTVPYAEPLPAQIGDHAQTDDERTICPQGIPERSDQLARRKAKGSAGGRPPAFDPGMYRRRNTVERGFNRIKHWRGVATRYDKYALSYLGGVTLAAIITYHRVRN